jgi:protein-disulfide isomerase
MGKDTKIILGVILATAVIIFGGIFLTSKSQNKPTTTANPSLLIKENSYKVTALNEKAVLVEFGDLQCPACGAYHPLIMEAKEEFKDSLTYVFRHFPLSQHKNAKAAAYALEAAGVQNKYWEMQDKLYATQSEWSNLANPNEIFLEYAIEFGLDKDKFTKDMNDPALKKKVEDDLADGTLLRVDSTPTFYLNGEKISFQDYNQLKGLISQ